MYRIASLVALLLIALPSSANPQDLYRAGLRSFEFGYWREALVFFAAAAREQPAEGASVREYGMWQAPYLPHFYQGAALYRLGAWAQALEALAESESQGAIKRRKSKKYYQRLLELREEIRQAIEREVGEVHRGAASDYQTFAALRQAPPALAPPEIVAAVPEIGEIDRMLASATSSLKNASLIAAASDLQKAMSLLDEAREGIVTVAREVRKRERELEEEQRRAAHQARRQQIRADLRQARQLIAAAGCQPRAIELLENVEQLAGLDGLGASGGAAAGDLAVLLARAHLGCGHLALADEYLRRAAEAGKTDVSPEVDALPEAGEGDVLPGEADVLPEAGEGDLPTEEDDVPPPEGEREGSTDRSRDERPRPAGTDLPELPDGLLAALSDYLLAVELAGEEDCQEAEISRLIESARRRLGPAADTSASAPILASLPFRYTPYLVLARAHGGCQARGDVETYLGRARDYGRASPAELAELETWLERNPPLVPYSGSYALLVGAYDYNLASGWPALYKPGEDVRQVRQALEAHGFEVQTLVNPASEELESSLAEFFAEYGQERGHRLVFYYAGHGHTESTDHGIKLGYIVPVDAGDPRQDRAALSRLIGMERFREYARSSNANDLLFMFDSCFAGTVFKATRSCLPPDCLSPGSGALTVRERVLRPVRMFLTAGGENQMVPDESVFRRMVTRALAGEADGDSDGFVLGTELGSFVQNMTLVERKSRSTTREASPLQALIRRQPVEPQWGTLSEGDFGLGDILFDTPESDMPASLKVAEGRGEIYTELAYWTAARNSSEPREYRRYVERFPDGRFAPLARWILERAESASGS